MHQIGIRKTNDNPIRLDQESRFQHTYVIGQTGTGKSTFLKQSFLQDVHAGFGACYFDFHGQDAVQLLDYIPRERIDDVIYVNPLNPNGVMGYNPLDGVRPEHFANMTDELVGSLRHIFRDSWGGRMDDILMNAIRPLFDLPQTHKGTLLDAVRMLNDPKFRAWVLKHCPEKTVHDFWQLEFGTWSKSNQAHDVNSSLNKIRRFQSAPIMRRVLGQPTSRINLATAIQQGQIVILDFNKWQMGEKNASILAALFLSRLIYEGGTRPIPTIEGVPAANLVTPFHIYLDEFHSITTTSTAEALSGIRKFRIGLTCCHQFTAQVQPQVLDAIIGNVGTKVVFRVGSDDARALHGAVEMPEPHHLTELPDYNFISYLKQGRSMITLRGMSVASEYDPQGYKTSILRRMDNHFNRPIAEVDDAYERRIERRFYSGDVPTAPGRTVKKKKGSEMQTVGAIMRDRFVVG